MGLRKKTEGNKVRAYRLTLPDDLADELIRVKTEAKKKGLIFDPKPELLKTLENSIQEGIKMLEKENDEVNTEVKKDEKKEDIE